MENDLRSLLDEILLVSLGRHACRINSINHACEIVYNMAHSRGIEIQRDSELLYQFGREYWDNAQRQRNQQQDALNTPLARSTIDLINSRRARSRAYVYFKQWRIGENIWHKIGVTNDHRRRDSEQNVLPVPARTLALLPVSTMDMARIIERSLHRLLVHARVRNARNREIFELEESEAHAIAAAINSFERI